MNEDFSAVRRDDSGAAAVSPEAVSRPVIRPRDQHNISRRDIAPEALKVLYRLARNHFTAYLVGGGVRDLLLGRRPKDFDVSTNAKPEQLKALFRNCLLIGRRFRLAHIRYGDKIVETSTFRRSPGTMADPADPGADLFQRDDNSFGGPEEDAKRRDFTINGLFYDIDTFSVIDYVGGLEDLAARSVRSIGDPNIRFREDPVRMVRAVRFASRLDFSIEAETLEAIKRHRGELAKASPARLLEEIIRLFAFSSGERAVRLLRETGLLEAAIPEMAAYLDDPDCDGDLFWRRLGTLDKGDTVLPESSPALIFSTLFLDLVTLRLERSRAPDRGPQGNFDAVRSCLSPMAERLKFPRKLTDRIMRMLLAQNRFQNQGHRRLPRFGFASQDWFQEALALQEIDVAAKGESQEHLKFWRRFMADSMENQDEARRQNRHEGRKRGGRHPDVREEDAPSENPEAAETAPPAADATEAPKGEERQQTLPGQGLSRSARRRRNRRRDRRERMEARNTSPVPSSGSEVPKSEEVSGERTDTPGDVGDSRPQSAPSRPPVKADPEEAPAVGQTEERGRGRRRRGRGGKSTARTAADEHENEAEPLRDGGDDHPLSVESFYQSLGKAGKAPAKGKEPKGRVAARAAEEKVHIAVDRDQDPERPTHWLDEI